MDKLELREKEPHETELVFYLQMKMEALKECFPKGSLLQIPELLAEKMSDVFSYMIFSA